MSLNILTAWGISIELILEKYGGVLVKKHPQKGFVLKHTVSVIGKIACYGLEDKKSNNEEEDKDEG